MTPRVSVVMSVYNGARHLAESVESVLNQEYGDFELILVDDGSTDESGDIAESMANRDRRIRLFRQANKGLTQALIHACANASGEFIARHDVGDLSAPDRLHKQQALLAGKPELSFVSCGTVMIGPRDEILSDAVPADRGRRIVESLSIAHAEGMEGPCHGSVMFRRSAYEKVGGYRPEFYFAQDLDLWSRLIEVGNLEFADEPLYSIRFTANSITAHHRSAQMLLRNLIREATLLRRSGASEADVLRKAAVVRPGSDPDTTNHDADAEYFIGSCLHQRGDPAAEEYLRRAIAAQPLHLKAWAKLLSRRMYRGV